MPAGRPKLDNETIQIRASKKLITIADNLGLNYKKRLAEHFEMMMCKVILLDKQIADCSICESIIERRRIIDEAYQDALKEMQVKIAETSKKEKNMIIFLDKIRGRGLDRGEAETKYGAVFPDHIWEEYGGKP